MSKRSVSCIRIKGGFLETDVIFKCGKCNKWYFKEDDLATRVRIDECTLMKICRSCKDKMDKENKGKE